MTDLHKECHCSVKIEHLSVTRGNQKILDDVNLEVKHGEITAIIGRNGAGKTTLLKAIMDRIPHTGTVTYFNSMGKKISQPKLGYVPQSLSFDRGTPLTVADLFCANSGMMPVWFRHKKDKIAHAKEMLAHVGAERLIDKPLGRISDPMPDMLILDEPVSALDRRGISSFYDLVTSLRSEYHMPVLLVSHDLGHVTKYCTRAALVDGTIVLTDTAKNILKHKEVREVFGLGEEGIL